MNNNLTSLNKIWKIIKEKNMYWIEDLKFANDKKHKYIVTIINPKTKRKKNIKFGSYNYKDYTIHKDPIRRENYRNRHKHDKINDNTKPGYYAYHLLW